MSALSSHGLLGRLLRKSVKLLRAGQGAYLLRRAWAARVGVFAAYGAADGISAWLNAQSCDWTLIVDHDLGGGANHYRNRAIAGLASQGAGALLFSVHPLRRCYQLQAFLPGGVQRRWRVDATLLADLRACRAIGTLVFNNAVGFPEPLALADAVVDFCAVAGRRLHYLVHDYQAVCPSHLLLDWQGRYCGVPAEDVCAACLPKLGRSDAVAQIHWRGPLETWRATWGKLLARADEITCFSPSAQSIVTRAYPLLSAGRIRIVPHAMDDFGGVPYAYPSEQDALCIGVVGVINAHKGADVLTALAQDIERRGLNARIKVLGTFMGAAHPCIQACGPYRRETLGARLRELGVHCVLMPSIWPETFSYVTHELIALGVPVACFNLGAQADAVRDYARGCLLPQGETGVVLDALLAFAQQWGERGDHAKTDLSKPR